MSLSINVDFLTKRSIRNFWENTEGPENAIYLGLPQMVRRTRTMKFSDLKQRVWKKLKG